MSGPHYYYYYYYYSSWAAEEELSHRVVVVVVVVCLPSQMAPAVEPYAVQKKMALDVSQEATIVLARGAMEPWLRVHGKLKKPEMNKKQQLELRECFELFDTGGSGVIPAEEVPLAFTVLGMNVKRSEIEAAAEEFNADKPIMEFPQFMQLMLSKLDKLPPDDYAPAADGKHVTPEYTLPFPFLAQAYRRKKLIEAVMGGDKPLQDRMTYRTCKAFRERQMLRDLAAGKPVQEPKSSWPMSVEPNDREKKRLRAASLKKPPKPEPPDMRPYVVQNMGTDVKELLLGEKRNEIIKTALESDVKFVPPTNKSIELDKPIESKDGEKKFSKAYLADKLATFRTDLQHKPAKKAQIIHVQAMKSLRDFIDKGAWQVKGSPLLYPASRCPCRSTYLQHIPKFDSPR